MKGLKELEIVSDSYKVTAVSKANRLLQEGWTLINSFSSATSHTVYYTFVFGKFATEIS